MKPRMAAALQLAGPWHCERERLLGLVATVNHGYYDDEDELPEPEAPYEIVDGVALIQMRGLMLNSRSPWLRGYGCVGIPVLEEEIRGAGADPKVNAVLILVDSPGGTAYGADDLSTAVGQVSEAKPVYAFAQNTMASGAVFATARCGKIFCSRSTLVGSIGTFRVVIDDSKAMENEGIKCHLISTGPLKGAEAAGQPVTDEVLAESRKIVDFFDGFFKQAVREGRGLRGDRLAAVSTGGMFGAEEAVGLGLVDQVATLEEAVDKCSKAGARKSGAARAAFNAAVGK